MNEWECQHRPWMLTSIVIRIPSWGKRWIVLTPSQSQFVMVKPAGRWNSKEWTPKVQTRRTLDTWTQWVYHVKAVVSFRIGCGFLLHFILFLTLLLGFIWMCSHFSSTVSFVNLPCPPATSLSFNTHLQKIQSWYTWDTSCQCIMCLFINKRGF